MSLLILEFPIKCQAYRIHQILVFKTLLCFIQKKKATSSTFVKPKCGENNIWRIHKTPNRNS